MCGGNFEQGVIVWGPAWPCPDQASSGASSALAMCFSPGPLYQLLWWTVEKSWSGWKLTIFLAGRDFYWISSSWAQIACLSMYASVGEVREGGARSKKDGRTSVLFVCLARNAWQLQHTCASSCYAGTDKQWGFSVSRGTWLQDEPAGCVTQGTSFLGQWGLTGLLLHSCKPWCEVAGSNLQAHQIRCYR